MGYLMGQLSGCLLFLTDFRGRKLKVMTMEMLCSC